MSVAIPITAAVAAVVYVLGVMIYCAWKYLTAPESKYPPYPWGRRP